MNDLLWRHEYYSEYYNCSFYDFRTIPIQKRQQTAVGISFIALFLFFEMLYIPLLWIMRKKVFFHQACYKIMFYVGIVDVACLCCNGFSTGLFAIFGYVYCSSPFVIHMLGSIALGLWVAQCDSAMIIALNRCLEMYDHHLCAKLFDGYKVVLWLMIPTCHALFITFFTTPIVFSGLYVSWFFNPHLGYFEDNGIRYVNWFHVVNNITLVTVLTSLYGVFVIVYIRKAHGASTTQKQVSFAKN
uniref:Uncharacterized protein n=1 Tax=Panagrolaimus davidi TaxID=227884 RepID=A0A914QVJ4_9BILA